MRRALMCFTLVTAATLVAPVATSQAATLKVTDATDDVSQIVDAEESPAAKDATPDIRTLTIKHTQKRIGIRLDFDGLDGPPDRVGTYATLFIEGIKSSQSRYVEVGSDSERGKFVEMTNPLGSGLLCRSKLRSRVDFDNDVIAIDFPRSCMGNPRKIKVAADTQSHESGDPDIYTYDDATQAGGRVDSDDWMGRYTRWVKRG